MASKRRGGFRPPELRGALGTLLRTTTDVVRGALERGAREGRARLDDVRANRRRHDALADLGEIVLDLIRRGEIDLDELPETRSLVRQLDELDASASDGGGETYIDDEPPRPSNRRRFDDRDRGRDDEDRGRGVDAQEAHDRDTHDRGPHTYARAARNLEPPRRTAAGTLTERDRRVDPDDATIDDRPRSRAANDGTVSSGATLRSTRPTTPARPRADGSLTTRAPTKPIKGLWRADVDLPGPEETAPRRPALAPDPHRQGGISFDDDDLADYMHPDDVPAKPAAGAGTTDRASERDPNDRDP
jgi:hypothetical protein